MKIHTDCCGPQYRFRQNFLKIATAKERLAAIVVHKFAQKYCFKGSWDATGKLITGNDGTGKIQQKWLEWKATQDNRIPDKTTLKTDRTFVGQILTKSVGP